MFRTHRTLLLTIVTAAVLTACGAPSSPGTGERTVDEPEARALAESAFDALNRGDYEAYSANWSADMKAAIGPDAFASFRSNVMADLGRYVSIEGIETASVQPGTYRYIFTVAFERGTAQLAFGFREGSDLIQGVFAL
jgi:hypothetical protein